MGPGYLLFEALGSAVLLPVLKDWDCCFRVPFLLASLSRLGSSSTLSEPRLLEVGAAQSPRPLLRPRRQPWFVRRMAQGVFEGLEKGRDLVGVVVFAFVYSGTAIEPRMGIWEANVVVLKVLCPWLAV